MYLGSCGALLIKEGIERSHRPDVLRRKASHFGRCVRNKLYQLLSLKVGKKRAQHSFIDCQHQQKTFSVTTFYTLFAFGSACGAFLRASQNRGNIPSFGPFLLVHMTKSKKTSTTEARKIPERESLFVYYILGSETGAVYPICFPPLEQ